MSAALELVRVSKQYAAGVTGCSARVEALRVVTLRVPKGHVIAVAGAVGAGKTTLLLCAAGLLRPDAGRVLWFGETGGAEPPVGVHYVSPLGVRYPFLTVREALECSLSDRTEGHTRGARVAQAAERAALLPYLGRPLAELGRSVLHRFALARTLLGAPRLLLLDGLFGGLDPAARHDLHALLRGLAREGVAMLAAEREPSALHGLASRTVILSNGRVDRWLAAEMLGRRRVLELDVEDPAAAAACLRRRHARARRQDEFVTVQLDAATPEEILALCRELDIAVRGSRVAAPPARVAQGAPAHGGPPLQVATS
jgi:ABC-type multidrug transport system ATPase subunit